MKNTNEICTVFMNDLFTYNKEDKSLKINEDIKLTEKEMNEVSKSYSGANRVHKPMGLLFWIDCKNGKANNWNN